jgi:hypothetical protein
VVGLVFTLRADDASESEGLDTSMHGEEAYVHAGGSVALTSHTSDVASPARELAFRTQS